MATERPINDPDEWVCECGAECGPSGLCKRCLAEKRWELDEHNDEPC
jgi:hypothetical protein